MNILALFWLHTYYFIILNAILFLVFNITIGTKKRNKNAHVPIPLNNYLKYFPL